MTHQCFSGAAEFNVYKGVSSTCAIKQNVHIWPSGIQLRLTYYWLWFKSIFKPVGSKGSHYNIRCITRRFRDVKLGAPNSLLIRRAANFLCTTADIRGCIWQMDGVGPVGVVSLVKLFLIFFVSEYNILISYILPSPHWLTQSSIVTFSNNSLLLL